MPFVKQSFLVRNICCYQQKISFRVLTATAQKSGQTFAKAAFDELPKAFCSDNSLSFPHSWCYHIYHSAPVRLLGFPTKAKCLKRRSHPFPWPRPPPPPAPHPAWQPSSPRCPLRRRPFPPCCVANWHRLPGICPTRNPTVQARGIQPSTAIGCTCRGSRRWRNWPRCCRMKEGKVSITSRDCSV